MKRLFATIIGIALLALGCCAFAAPVTKPLPVNQAFRLSAVAKDPQTVLLTWRIAPGYYLYRDRFHFTLQDKGSAELGRPILPPGIPKYDHELGHYQVYADQVSIATPVLKSRAGVLEMLAHYQGCSAKGFCYPPTVGLVQLSLTDHFDRSVAAKPIDDVAVAMPQARQDKITAVFRGHHWWVIVLSFIGFGVLLSFTPCVLPMIPILSSIIIGNGEKVSAKKGFILSLIYILAMSVTYAIAGMVIGYVGSNVQIILQKPWVLAMFSVVFVLMALSMFGFYNLELPRSWQARIANISHHQKHGTYLGVFVMGVLATLIVSPCVTPALVGALAYISQTGDALMGGAALFALGFGMGVPLLVIGTLGGKFLPHTGAWMNTVKAIMGVLLLGVAIYLLERVIPGPVSLVLWAALLIVSSMYMGTFVSVKTNWAKLWRGIGWLMFIYGAVLLVGAATGGSNPLRPLMHLPGLSHSAAASRLTFERVKDIQALDRALLAAKLQHKPVLLDFYADWCVACKELDEHTFANPQVQAKLKDFVLLRVDMTANNANDRALMKRYGVIAPPTLIFFDAKGREFKSNQVVGNMAPADFLKRLDFTSK